MPKSDRANSTAERFYRAVVAYLQAAKGLGAQSNSGPPPPRSRP